MRKVINTFILRKLRYSHINNRNWRLGIAPKPQSTCKVGVAATKQGKFRHGQSRKNITRYLPCTLFQSEHLLDMARGHTKD
jgi:hypothetical protein